jgi:hypothetical protein
MGSVNQSVCEWVSYLGMVRKRKRPLPGGKGLAVIRAAVESPTAPGFDRIRLDDTVAELLPFGFPAEAGR